LFQFRGKTPTEQEFSGTKLLIAEENGRKNGIAVNNFQ
jgi:hypothetical protein